MELPLLIFGIITSAALFFGIFLPIFAAFRYPVPDEAPIHRQIAQAVGVDQETIFEAPGFAPILSLFVGIARRINIAALRNKIRQDLLAAGNPSGYTIEQYIALCLFSATAIGGISGFMVMMLDGRGLLLFLPVMTIVGFGLPIVALGSAAAKRTRSISKQLPYTLDLIALVMASGSSFTEAVETLIRDNPDDDLNQELAFTLSEMEFGSTRMAAMVNLADRIPLESLRSVIGAINQAEKLGTPLSSILKTQADMLRMHRSVRAEKLSASASLKILVPSVMILFAVLLIIGAPLMTKYFSQGGFW